MKILTGIPVIKDSGWFKECLIPLNRHRLLIVDNNADDDCKKVIKKLKCNKIVNKKNVYVNKAWNQIMEWFINNEEYTHLNILNSDLRLMKGWESFLSKVWDKNIIPLATETTGIPPIENGNNKYKIVPGGHPGICIILSREQVKAVYPIPEDIKIWFGDNYIWGVLQNKHNIKLGVYESFYASHGNSRSVSQVEGIYDIIEEDKKVWSKYGDQWIQNKNTKKINEPILIRDISSDVVLKKEKKINWGRIKN